MRAVRFQKFGFNDALVVGKVLLRRAGSAEMPRGRICMSRAELLRTIFTLSAATDKDAVVCGGTPGTYFVKKSRVHPNNDTGDFPAIPIADNINLRDFLTGTNLSDFPSLRLSYHRDGLARMTEFAYRSLDTESEVEYGRERFWRVDTNNGPFYVPRYAMANPVLPGTEFRDCGAEVEPIGLWPDNIGPWENSTFAGKVVIKDPGLAADTLCLPPPLLRSGLQIVSPFYLRANPLWRVNSGIPEARLCLPVAPCQNYSVERVLVGFTCIADFMGGMGRWRAPMPLAPFASPPNLRGAGAHTEMQWMRYYGAREVSFSDVPDGECFGGHVGGILANQISTLFRVSNKLDGLVRADRIGPRVSDPEQFLVFNWKTRRPRPCGYCFIEDVEAIPLMDKKLTEPHLKTISDAFHCKRTNAIVRRLPINLLKTCARYAEAKSNGWLSRAEVLQKLGFSGAFFDWLAEPINRVFDWKTAVYWEVRKRIPDWRRKSATSSQVSAARPLYNISMLTDLFLLNRLKDFRKAPGLLHVLFSLNTASDLDRAFIPGDGVYRVDEVAATLGFPRRAVSKWLSGLGGNDVCGLWPENVVKSPPHIERLLTLTLGRRDTQFVLTILRDQTRYSELLVAMMSA